MSVSKWRYTEECNGRPCPGDCDHCSFEPADLISRDDAIEAVRKELVCDGRHEAHDKTCRFIADVLLSALPSADAVQGEWIDKEIPCNPYPPVFCVECSECGYRVGRETFQENTFNYCPNCGARMYKGGDGEWVEEDEYGDLWVCDQCGFANEYKINFCPNCGAKMKGGEDE